MAKNLHQLLATDNLIRAVQVVANGVPEDILPPGMFSVTDSFEGNAGRYIKLSGTQRTARVQNYGGKAHERNKWGLGDQPVTLLHAFESLSLSPNDLINLLSEEGSTRQIMGRQTVDRNLINFGQLFRNLRVSAATSAIATGYIYANSDGELLPSSSGAAVSVDFGVSASHRTTCGGYIHNWNVAGTDIQLQLENLKSIARQATGLPLKYAVYGKNVPGYFGSNTIVSGYLKASPGLSEAMIRGAAIPDGLMGLTWVPGNQSFYRDKDDAVQTWIGEDAVIFMPEVSQEWWGFLEGSYLVPTSIDVSSDAAAALGQLKQVQGTFSYATLSINPPGITQFTGDTFLPVITKPDAIFIADVLGT